MFGGSAVLQITKEKGKLSFLRVLGMENTKEIKSCACSRINACELTESMGACTGLHQMESSGS